MTRSRALPILMIATLVPTVALGGVGFWLLQRSAEGSQARYRERADGVAEAVRASVGARLADVARGGGAAIRFSSTLEGEWLAPALEPDRPEQSSPRDPVAARLVRREIDTFQAQGDTEAARARLRSVAESSEDRWLCAWAWTTLAILEDRAGNHVESETAWNELIGGYPDMRDERGLLRSFVARSSLAKGQPDERDRLISLYGDAVDDTASRDETSTRLFKAGLLARLGEPEPGSLLSDVRARDLERERLLRALSTRTTGAADWLAQGAPGSVAVFESQADALFDQSTETWVFSVADSSEPDENGAVDGGLIELHVLLAEALAIPAIAAYQRTGFAIEFVSMDGSSLASVGDVPESRNLLTSGSLAPPFSNLMLQVHATDLQGFLARERRGALFLAGLMGLTLLGSAVAAFATFRAVRREIDAAQARESFVAAVTHELKTPLASIRLLGEVLSHGGVEEDKVREFGARTMAEAERLSQLVTSVLELARLEHEKPSQHAFELVDLNQIARGCAEVFSPIARERGFELRLHETSNDALVRGDERALTAAVGNLLDNAFKYADDPHTVDVVVEQHERMNRIAVLDRGRGVPEGEEEMIFQPFQRVGDELTRDRPGVGLGLALVSRIAREHGGQAAYAAREGGGSRFAMDLPAAHG